MDCRWCAKPIPPGLHHLVRYCNSDCRYLAGRQAMNYRKREEYQQLSQVVRPADIDPVEVVLARDALPESRKHRECRHVTGFVYDMCRGCLLMSDEIREIKRRRLLNA